MVNVGKYTSPMDPMGKFVWLHAQAVQKRTPLRCAVQAQDTEMAKLLIQARADPNERDAKGVCVSWDNNQNKSLPSGKLALFKVI